MTASLGLMDWHGAQGWEELGRRLSSSEIDVMANWKSTRLQFRLHMVVDSQRFKRSRIVPAFASRSFNTFASGAWPPPSQERLLERTRRSLKITHIGECQGFLMSCRQSDFRSYLRLSLPKEADDHSAAIMGLKGETQCIRSLDQKRGV